MPRTKTTMTRNEIMEAAAKYLLEDLVHKPTLQSPYEVTQYLKTTLKNRKHEHFSVVFLNTRHAVITCEELFHGTIDGATIYPRVVAQKALEHNAAAVILAHNHPSGSPEPSLADQIITRRLKEALGVLDIRLLDHFIIGHGEPKSMAEAGYL